MLRRSTSLATRLNADEHGDEQAEDRGRRETQILMIFTSCPAVS